MHISLEASHSLFSEYAVFLFNIGPCYIAHELTAIFFSLMSAGIRDVGHHAQPECALLKFCLVIFLPLSDGSWTLFFIYPVGGVSWRLYLIFGELSQTLSSDRLRYCFSPHIPLRILGGIYLSLNLLWMLTRFLYIGTWRFCILRELAWTVSFYSLNIQRGNLVLWEEKLFAWGCPASQYRD